jgi:hypothetical protein
MTNQTPPDFAPLQLTDLVPQNATFSLSEVLGADAKPAPLTLRRWSLRTREHAVKKYTARGLKLAFEKLEIGTLADLAFFMLDDESKKHFADVDAFLDKVVTMTDQIELIKAMAKTVGVGEPELKKISDALNPQKIESEPADPNFTAPSP